MEKLNTNSHKGFKWAMMTTATIVLFVILHIVQEFVKIDFSILYGLVMLSIIIFTIIGAVDSIKGIKEPNTWQKIMGLIFNTGFVILFVFIIIGNALDIYKAIQ